MFASRQQHFDSHAIQRQQYKIALLAGHAFDKNNFKEMSRSLLTYKKGKKAKENIIAELKKRLEASATEMKNWKK